MRKHGRWALGGCTVLLLGVAPAVAQTPLLMVKVTPVTVGADADAVGDWDGDGFGDLAVGIPGTFSVSTTPGSVRILSGRDGSLLAEFLGAVPMQRFGTFVAGLGDMDADGAVDVAVGSVPSTAVGLQPVLQAFSGATGAALFDQALPPLGFVALDGAGDVDADGHADLVKGGLECPGGFGTNGPGDVTVYSGATGGVLHVSCGDTIGDGLGRSVAGAGDVNADGYADVVAGATEFEDFRPNSLGYVRVISGFDGATLHNWEGPLGTYTGYGEVVDSAGDVNADGCADIVVGTREEQVGGTYPGSATVYSGLDGSTLHQVTGTVAFGQFGYRVAGAGDMDGDGLADFAIGTMQLGGPGPPQLGYEVHSGADAALLHQVALQPAGTDFGTVLRGAGDINADGTPDLVVVADDSDFPSVRLYSGTPVLFANLGFALPGSQGTPHLEVEGVLARALPLELRVSTAPPLAPLLLLIGNTAAPVPFHGGLLVPIPLVSIGGLVTDATGALTLQASLTADPPTGMQVVVQGWLPDPPAPSHVTATNAVQGVAP